MASQQLLPHSNWVAQGTAAVATALAPLLAGTIWWNWARRRNPPTAAVPDLAWLKHGRSGFGVSFPHNQPQTAAAWGRGRANGEGASEHEGKGRGVLRFGV